MPKKQFSVLVIAATYIGTVVGAGFASGQEVLQFFGYFGRAGLAGLAITAVLLSVFGYIIMELGRRLGAESHLPVIRYAGGRWIGSLLDWVTTAFLFGGLVTMGAGAGAIFSEQFGLPFIWGSVLMIAAALFTVLFGISGVVRSISFVVPLLLAAVFGVAVYTIATDYPALLATLRSYSEPSRAPLPYWPLTTVLYVSYNLVLAIAILAPLGAVSGPNRLRTGAILGGIGLGIGATLINLAILTHIGRAASYEIPMIMVAGTVSPLVRTVYTLILLAEVYTTAVGSLYGFVARLSKQGTPKYRYLSSGAAILALGLSQFGFSNLVGTLFPAVGFAGLLMLAALAFAVVRGKIGEYSKRGIKPVQPSPSLTFHLAEEISKRGNSPDDEN
ncbi:MAG: hypothetical protein GXY92_01845 [Syntrophomonadaceae bacterium]|nr:hypothetical protein [Syntrophomonadaceae bacterium]